MVTSEIPDTHGNIILNSQLYAAPGQADRLQGLLSNIHKNANSDAEPDCFEFRTARSFVAEGVIKFTVWEVYKNSAALNTHFASGPFHELEAGIKAEFRPPSIEYFYEF